MSITIEETALPGVLLVSTRRFGDDRGWFSETFNQARWREAGLDFDPVQDNHSLSRDVGILRGLHFQNPPAAQAKLVRVIHGAILDVAVDIRQGSPTFLQHVAVRLDAVEGKQLFVPAGFAHGFCVLEPDTEVVYKVDQYYSPDHDRSIAWNDPAIGIDWPVSADAAILSGKDQTAPVLAKSDCGFVYGGEGED